MTIATEKRLPSCTSLGGEHTSPAPLAMAIAAAIALLFTGHLLLTSQPFWGSGTDIWGMEHPLHAFAASRLSQGDLPLWNPYHLGGIPFQAGVHGYLSPSFWLTALLPPLFDIKLAIVLHAMFAAAGAAFFASRRVKHTAPAVLMGITFALSGFAMSHLFAGHRKFFFTVAYLPWIIALIDQAIQHRTRRRIALAGFVCGLMVLCGHYQVIYIGMLGAGIYFVLDRSCGGTKASFVTKCSRAVLVMGAVVLIGVGIAAVQVLPMFETLKLSQRSGGGIAFAAGYSSTLVNLLTYLWPNLFGNGVDVPFFGSWAYWEALGYIGLVPLVLVAAAPFVLPFKEWLPAATLILLGICLSLGSDTAVFAIFARLTPGASLFRGAGRYVLLVALFGGLLAAQVLDRWMSGLPRRKTWVWLIAPIPLLVVATASVADRFFEAGWHDYWWGFVMHLDIPISLSKGDWQAAFELVRFDGLRTLLIVAVASALLIAGLRVSLRRWLAVCIVALVACDLYTFGHRFLGTSQPTHFEWPTELVAFLEKHDQPGLRIIDDPLLMCPGRGAQHGIGHIGGYDIFIDQAYGRYMARANRKDPREYVTLFRTENYSKLHDLLGGTFLLTAGALDGARAEALSGFDDWEFKGQFEDVWVYANPDPKPRAFIVHRAKVADEETSLSNMANPAFNLQEHMLVNEPLDESFTWEEPDPNQADFAKIVAYEPDRVIIKVQATAAGALVLSDNWHSGWRATINGKQAAVVRANQVMRAVPVPKGSSEVIFAFHPTSFTIGSALSMLVLAGVVLLFFWKTKSTSSAPAHLANSPQQP